MTLIITSIDHSQLSKSVPLLAFGPVFILITGFFILGEVPSMIGLLGIVIVVIGVYALKAHLHETDHLEPFKRLIHDKCSRYMLVAALFIALAAPLFKLAVLESSPTFALACTQVVCTIYAFAYALIRGRRGRQIMPTNPKRLFPLVLLGISLFFTGLFWNTAVLTGIVPYVSSVKRLSIFFNVLIGIIIFKEKHAKHRLIAGAIMVIGAIIIGLS